MTARDTLRLARWLLAIGWGALVFFVVADNVADHPLRHPVQVRRNLVAISPQGWAFFTRDPREPVDRVYLDRDERLIEANYTNTSGRNLWGLRRAARAVNVELASLLAQVPKNRWRECADSLAVCLARFDDAPRPVVDNTSVLQSLCGDLVVERRPPVPWAWSRSPRPIHMPGELVRMTARCGGEGRSDA